MYYTTNIAINILPPSDEESEEEEIHQKKKVTKKQWQDKNFNKADTKEFEMKNVYRQHKRLQRVSAVENEYYVNNTFQGDELSVVLPSELKANWSNSLSPPTALTKSISTTSENAVNRAVYDNKNALEKVELNDPQSDIRHAEDHQNSENKTLMSLQQVERDANCEKLENTNENFDEVFIDRSRTQGKACSRWTTLRHVIKATTHRRKSADDFIERFDTQRASLVKSTVLDVESGQVAKKPIKRFSTLYNCCVKCKPLQPDGWFMFCWLLFVSLATEYDMWIQPMRAGFPGIQDYYGTVWSILDRVADVIYYCDFVVQFRTGYLEHGILVTTQGNMNWHYIKSKFFWIDLLTLLPTDLLFIGIGIQPLLRSFKFLKLYRIVQCYRMALTRTSFPNVLRMANLIHILLLLCHLLCILRFQISHLSSDEHERFNDLTTTTTAITTSYLVSFHWAMLTITTIGDLATPETNALYMFQIVSYLIGIFIFAYIMGQVGNVINNKNSSRLQYERSLDDAKLFMKRHNVPKDLQSKVQKWYDYSWTKGRMCGNDDISSLAILPDRLRTLIAIHVNLDILRKVSIFGKCEPQFLQDILLKMTSTMCNPGDLVVKRGEIAQEMFIIADGKLEVLNDDDDIIATLESGDFFGEIGILNLEGVVNRRTADVRSVGFTELFVLKRDVILRAMKFYPDAKASLINHAIHRLQKLQRSQSVEVQNDTKVEQNLPERKDKLRRTSMLSISAQMPSLRARAYSNHSIDSQDTEIQENGVNDTVKNLQQELQQKNDLIQVLEAQLYEAEFQLARKLNPVLRKED